MTRICESFYSVLLKVVCFNFRLQTSLLYDKKEEFMILQMFWRVLVWLKRSPKTVYSGSRSCQTTGHWRCTHGTNTKFLMLLYRLLYNGWKGMLTPKMGGETWPVLGYTYQHCMRCVEKLLSLISVRLLLTQTCRLYLYWVFYDVYLTSVLFWRTIRWRHALNANVW